MGTSTDGQLSYGIMFEEGFRFPWDAEEFDGDIGDWWKHVKGFVNPIESPWDEDGQYRPGYHENSPEIGKYFEHQHAWAVANPLPVEIVNYCSYDAPMYILAIKHFENSRGYPHKIDVNQLLIAEQETETLMAFIKEFHIDTEDEPQWWLSSFWG